MAIPDNIKDMWDKYFRNKPRFVPAEAFVSPPEPQPKNSGALITFYEISGLRRNAGHPNINSEGFDVSVKNAVRYRESAGGRKVVDITAADNIFLISPVPLDENFLLLVQKKNGTPDEPVASGKLVRKCFQRNGQAEERYYLEIPGELFRYAYAGDYFLIVACPGANLGNALEQLYAKEIHLNFIPEQAGNRFNPIELYKNSGLYRNAEHPNINSEWLDVSVKNAVYYRENAEGRQAVDIMATDGIFLVSRFSLKEDFLLLVEKKNGAPDEPVAPGKLVRKQIQKNGRSYERYYLEIPGKLFRHVYAGDYFLIVASDDGLELYAKEIRLNAIELPRTNSVLCVDFGTSNTTAGTYNGQRVEIVKFVTETQEESCLLPTLVYIRAKGDNDAPPEILFGYEAHQILLEKEYSPKGSFFFEIKHWLAQDLETEEEVTDENGNIFLLRRGDIIAAYIRNVLRIAEINLKRQFHTLHFSAPVKLKSYFIRFLQQSVFPPESGYDIVPDSESLDEGIAIIYHYISERKADIINNRPDANGENEGQIMIIDCGGGTTDVASCRYRFDRQDTGIKTTLTTKFENGNSQYGGNNVTWRIFELLKIKLAEYYQRTGASGGSLDVSINNLMQTNEVDFLEVVDDCVTSRRPLELYRKLDKACDDSEEILPTYFGDTDTKQARENARRNFNIIWEMAEKIKIAFYSRDDLATMDFRRERSQQIGVKGDDTRLLHVRANLDDSVEWQAPDIEMNTKEVDALLRPEIYYLLASLFTAPNGKPINLDKPYITSNGAEVEAKFHLSGQSCRISLFRELLKEFVPGRKTRDKGKNVGGPGSSKSDEMKLECVRGCVQYFMEQSAGAVIPEIRAEAPNIPYQVLIDRGWNTPQFPLIDGSKIFTNDSGVSFLSEIHLEQRETRPGIAHITVVNRFGQVEKDRYEDEEPLCLNQTADGESLDELCKRIQRHSLRGIERYRLKDSPEETAMERFRRDMENVRCDSGKKKLLIFAFPNNAGYGYTLYQVLKYRERDGQERYCVTSEKDNYYERIDRRSIFDGKRKKDWEET